MVITLIRDNSFVNYIWYTQIEDGIRREASKKRYKLVFRQDPEPTDEIVLIVGASPSWITKKVKKSSELHLRTVAVNGDDSLTNRRCSQVFPDYQMAARECITYLQSINRTKTALYGINPESSSDLKKAKFFEGCPLFYNTGSLLECYRSFSARSDEFDSLICMNDVVAVSLLKHLEEEGKNTDKTLISYGNSLFLDFLQRKIVSVTVDNDELGVQAVRLCSFVYKNDANVTVKLEIPCRLILPGKGELSGEVTENQAIPNTEIDYYKDPEVGELLAIEEVLQKADITDMKILRGLLERKRYPDLTEEVNLSETALKYRINRMKQLTNSQNKSDLIEKIKKYM